MSSSNTDTGDTVISTSTTTTQINGGLLDALDATNSGGNTVVTMEPRESLITTAVNFLQNSKVRHTTLLQKQQFLRSKGLTAHEIQLACERAGVFSQDPNKQNTVINMGISSQTHSQLALQPRPTALGRIREILHSAAIFGGLGYAIYLFWKNYVEPFLFGKKKKKPINDALEDIEKKLEVRITDVTKDLDDLKVTLTAQQRDQAQQFNREFSNFRSDLEAIKGLLLNRKQFASPLTSVAAPPSIPAWQLAASSSPHRHHRHSQSDDNEKADDAGSGSGSSETEVVTKNSDSSLEIM